MAYRARFLPVVPVLMVVFGAALIPLCVLLAVDWSGRSTILAILFLLVIILIVLGVGIARLRRAARSGWTALAVDAQGVRLGAAPGRAPRTVPWAEISAVVCFETPRIVHWTPQRHIGVQLRPGLPDGVEAFRDRLGAAAGRTDLDDGQRTQLESGAMSIDDPEHASPHPVSYHLVVRDWVLSRKRLEGAVRQQAPDVEFVSVGPDDPAPDEWLEYREFLDDFEAEVPAAEG